MGGQQFVSDGILFDTRSMRRIVTLDPERGIVEAEAGIEWPELIQGLIATTICDDCHISKAAARLKGSYQPAGPGNNGRHR